MSIKAALALDGYVFLPRFEESAEAAATRLGEAIMPLEDKIVQQLIPRAISTPNTYSGMFGLNNFPFHTDLAHWQRPPRYFILHCVKGFADVPTLLLDGQSVVESVTADILQRAVVRPRRPQAGSMRPLCLWQADTGEGALLRWDEVFLKPASRIGELAFNKMREHLKAANPTPVALVDTGLT